MAVTPETAQHAAAHVQPLVLALYDPSVSNDTRSELTTQLKAWQKQGIAWHAALYSLQAAQDGSIPDQSTAMHVALFALETLRNKVELDWRTVPESLPAELRWALLHLTMQAASIPAMQVLARTAARAFAALAAQWTQWGQPAPVATILAQCAACKLGGRGEPLPGTCEWTAPGFTAASMLLRELIETAEGMNRTRLPSSAQERLSVSCQAAAGYVLEGLDSAVPLIQAQGDESLVVALAETWRSWALRCPDGPAGVMVSPVLPLLVHALSLDGSSQAADSAAYSLIVLADHYNGHSSDPLQQRLLEAMLGLDRACTAAIQDEDVEVLERFARVWAHLGERWAHTLLTTPALAAPYCQLVLRCTQCAEFEVCSLTLPFWVEVGHQWKTLMDRRSEAAAAAQRSMRPVQQHAVSALVRALQFPADADAWTSDKLYDFKHAHRYDVADALLLLAQALGIQQVLAVIAHQLDAQFLAYSATSGQGKHVTEQELTGLPPLSAQAGMPVVAGTWQGLEAALYAIRAVAREVPHTESAVLAGLLRQSTMSRMPHHEPEVMATLFRTIARYAEWMAAQADSTPLHEMLELTIHTLQGLAQHSTPASKYPDYMEHVATATRELCWCGASKIPLAALNLLLHDVLPKLATTHAVLLMQGVAGIAIHSEDASAVIAAVDQVAQGPVQRLQDAVQSPGAAARQLRDAQGAPLAAELIACADAGKLAACQPMADFVRLQLQVLRALLEELQGARVLHACREQLATDMEHMVHPAARIVAHLLPAIRLCIEQYCSVDSVLEAVVSLFKHAVRTAKLNSGALLAPLLQIIQAVLQHGVQMTGQVLHAHAHMLPAQRAQALAAALAAPSGETLLPAVQAAAAALPLAAVSPKLNPGFVYINSILVGEYARVQDATLQANLAQLLDMVTRHVTAVLPCAPVPGADSGSPSPAVTFRTARSAGDVVRLPPQYAHGLPGPTAAIAQATAGRMDGAPDLVEDWLTVVERGLLNIPGPVLTHCQTLDVVAQYLMAGMGAASRGVVRNCMRVCSSMLEIARPHRHDTPAENEARQSAVRQLVQPYLQAWVDQAMGAVAGGIGINAVNDPDGNATELFSLIQQVFGADALKAALHHSVRAGTIPARAFTDDSDALHWIEAAAHARSEAVLSDILATKVGMAE